MDESKLAKVQACLTAGMSVHQTVAATGVSESSVKRYRRQLNLRDQEAV